MQTMIDELNMAIGCATKFDWGDTTKGPVGLMVAFLAKYGPALIAAAETTEILCEHRRMCAVWNEREPNITMEDATERSAKILDRQEAAMNRYLAAPSRRKCHAAQNWLAATPRAC